MPDQQAQRQRLDRSRVRIASGCIISVVGVALYLFVTWGSDPNAPLPEVLSARGGTGWLAVCVILVGVAVWVAGWLGFANEAEDPETAARRDAASPSRRS